jgi:flagellar M-ring protein FliF
MKPFVSLWAGLPVRARAGLVAGLALILAAVVALAVWAYRPNYQVLFADLNARDAAAMTAELDKSKVPYELAAGGATILVPQELVYKTRLQLMGSDVPLHGAVGFEVFNNGDFGMTEFVQKVNYQRAVQGELTRTIQSIEGIQAARVHLAIPEQGLFRKAQTKPKASVTVAMKPGQRLAPEQISGIQRLVAASVPDVAAQDVTIVDQQGVALSPATGDEQTGPVSEAQLDQKRKTEEYLLKKLHAVLDRTYGAGAAIASVDVVLSHDHGRVTTEEVLPVRGAGGNQASGLVVRERHSEREPESGTAPVSGKSTGASSSSESEYQVGRRVEQMAVAGGAVKRMTVAVVVKNDLSDSQLAGLREVVALAVGMNPQRGDAIVVNSIARMATPSAPPAAAPDEDKPVAEAASVSAAPEKLGPDPASLQIVVWVLAGLLALVSAAAAWRLHRQRQRAHSPLAVPMLDDDARALVLADVRRWLAEPVPGLAGEESKR